MAHQLDADLVIPDSETRIQRESTAEGRIVLFEGGEVIDLIEATLAGKEQHALFGDEVIQLELTELEVEPAAAEDVIETDEGVLEVEGCRFVRGWQQRERDVFVEGARRSKYRRRKDRSHDLSW